MSNELVLAIHRAAIIEQDSDVRPIHLGALDQTEYALLPRSFVDNKTDSAVALGKLMPQLLGYFQIKRQDGRILAYQRKGKEAGLLGKWSIGVGGHISHEDYLKAVEITDEELPKLSTIVYVGSARELNEELGIELLDVYNVEQEEQFLKELNHVLITMLDVTSTVHLGLPLTIELTEGEVDSLKLDPSEFNNFQWLTKEELKTFDRDWETWSNIVIREM